MGRKKRNPTRRLDPASVREACDVAEVLGRLGLEPEESRSGDELLVLCPNPDHGGKGVGDKSVGTFSIHSEQGDEANGMAHCWSCKWSGDIYEVVRLLSGCGFREALEFVAGGVAPEVGEDEEDEEDPEVYWKDLREWRPPGTRMPKGCVPVEEGSAAANYLTGRLFGIGLVRREGILDWRKAERIVVPIRMGGKLVTWVARSYGDDSPKVLTPKREEVGAGAEWSIGGYDDARPGGVLNTTESWANRLRLLQVGISSPLNLCGSDLTEDRVLAIMALNPSKLVHWIDGDAAGRRLAGDLADAIGTRFAYEVVPFRKKRDVADCRPSEIRKMKPVAWSDYQQTLHGRGAK